MKTNEAPYKIYLATTEEVQNLDNSFVGIAHSDPEDIVEPVEYVRTDAFIEKALAYLHDKFSFNNVFYGIVNTDFNAMEEMYEDFKKYMEL